MLHTAPLRCPTPPCDRRRFAAPDRLFLNVKEGARDPAMLLRGPDGLHCARRLPSGEPPQSQYLESAGTVLNRAALYQIEMLAKDPSLANDLAIMQRGARTPWQQHSRGS